MGMDTQLDSKLATRLIDSTLVAEGTKAFRFHRPAGFGFKAGQAIDLILGEERHAFSLVNAPHENELVIATRMRDSAYKRALGALGPGAPVAIDGPFGSLMLHNKRARAAVFVAGGIGITPFVSILREASRPRIDRPLALLYSNRRPEDAAYLAELQNIARANTAFRLVATMTEMAKSTRGWDGETRFVDAALLQQVAAGLPEPIYYLAGPPAMVEAAHRALDAAGVDDDDIRTEAFSGY